MKLEKIVRLKMIEKDLSYTDIGRLLNISSLYVSDIVKERREGKKYKSKILKILDIPENYKDLEIIIIPKSMANHKQKEKI